MDFSWNEEQLDLKEAAFDFAKSKLSEGIIELDKNSEFSHVNWKACADFGLQNMLVPESYGGMGLNALDFTAVMEGIGKGCRDSGLMFSINAHILACVMPLLHYGSDELKQKFLQRLASGELIGANAMTEPDTGSDVYAMRSTAVRDNDFFIINGSKTFVTNGPIADVFIVYAKTDSSKGFFGISCFLVEKGTEGLSVGRKIEKMGLKTSPMSELGLIDCKVPASNMIGGEGSGGITFSDSMEWERSLILAYCIGVMERQIEDCLAYARIRKPGKQPISKYQSVTNKIADMKMRLEASRLMLYKVAWLKSLKKAASMESSLAKLYISDAFINNCRDAVQIYGGYGYMVEYELERELRDALAGTLYSGTSEIQRNIVSSLLL
jgi:alkylation response protein AidB-like acyl-CoA dehydrogenase